VVLEGAQDPVGHGAVDAHGIGEFGNGERLLRLGEDLQRPDAAGQRLGRGSLGSAGVRGHGVHPRGGDAGVPGTLVFRLTVR